MTTSNAAAATTSSDTAFTGTAPADTASAALVAGMTALTDGQFRPIAGLFPPQLEQLFTPDYVQYEPGMAPGLTGVRSFFSSLQAAFPDLHGRVDHVVFDGDKLVAAMTWQGTHDGPFLGAAPTGRQLTYSRIEIWRVRDGKLTEHWGYFDYQSTAEMLAQLTPRPDFT